MTYGFYATTVHRSIKLVNKKVEKKRLTARYNGREGLQLAESFNLRQSNMDIG